MAEPNRSTTPRGFAVYDQLTDTYGSVIRVQQSSAATEPCCWIFAAQSNGGAAPHLNVEQAKRVRDALDAFIAEAGDG
jgi:hypothetical protein